MDGQLGRLGRNQRESLQQISRGEPWWARHTTAILCRAKGVMFAAVAMTSCLRLGLLGMGGYARISRNEGVNN